MQATGPSLLSLSVIEPLSLRVYMAAQLDIALGDTLQGSSAWAVASNKKRSGGAFWEEEVVQLMMGRPVDVVRTSAHAPLRNAGTSCSTTLDLLGAAASSARPPSPPPPPPPMPPPHLAHEDPESNSSCCFDLDADSPLPSGWEKCLDLQTGSMYYLNRSTGLRTSCDPRKATASSVNWPTSPSSSSDLTFEGAVPAASSIGKPPLESTHLDLTLSLKPSSPSCLRPNSLNQPINPSLNHDLKSDFNHKLRSLISSQGPLHTNPSLPFHSLRTSSAVPTGSSSTTSPSSPSKRFFQELSVFKDLGTYTSSKESTSVSVNQSLRHGSNSLSVSARQKPAIRRETHSWSPISRGPSVSARGNNKPINSDTHMNANGQMITVGCANCLMFVMLPKSCSPRCPRCGASIDSDLPLPPPAKKPKLGFSLS